jgi:hypothetical protein
MILSSLERRWAHAILDAMFPRDADDALPEGIVDLDVDGYLDDLLTSVPVVSHLGMRAGFVAIAVSPPFTIYRLRTFTGLATEDRVRVLEKLYKSRIYHVRQLVVLVKTTGAMLYCAAPSARAVMQDGLVRLRKSGARDGGVSPLGEVANVPA